MTTRIALVTGGNRGIGLEISKQLIGHGLRVILTSRDERKGRPAADKIGAEYLALDVGSPESVQMAYEQVVRAFGRLALGSEASREIQPIDTVRVVGQWRVDGDTIRLQVSRDQALQGVVEMIKGMNPSWSDAEVRAKVDAVMADVVIPDQLVGTVEGTRLSGRDKDGRQLTFRRPVP